MGRRHFVALSIFVGTLVACGDDGVDFAQCNACFGESFRAQDCEMQAQVAGCSGWEFLPTVSGACENACTFTDCDSEPRCIAEIGPPDSGAGVDAASPRDAGADPACMGATGLFPNCDLCQGDCNMVNINGVVQFTCDCNPTCPCGFSCGSIPLPVGGTLGSVCAP